MLHFISSIFSSADARAGSPDKTLVDKATDRVVDATDSRLRGFGNYRKHLRPAVGRAVEHIRHLVGNLPAAVEISSERFRADDRLRAFFVSSKHMQETLAGCQTIKEFLRDQGGSPPDNIFGTLSMYYSEKNILGMGLRGDTVHRDVPQVQVGFSDHRFVGASDSEDQARRNLEIRGFDFLTEKILESIIADRGKRSELEQQHRILRRKLDTLRAGNWGLTPMLAEKEVAQPDLASLEKEIASLDTELQQLGSRAEDLERSMDQISRIMNLASESLVIRGFDLHLDKTMTKKVTDKAEEGHHLKLTEAAASSGERRILLFGHFPTRELPKQQDFIREAQRYLG